VAIVTGGGRGIGKAFCLRLAQEGAKVVVADIIDTAGTVKEIEAKGGTAIGLHVDVSREEDTKRMAEETIARFGRIDILVNNAAVFYGLKDIPFEEITVEMWDKQMAVQPKGSWLCVKAVVPQMKKQGKGKIINIASDTVFIGRPQMMFARLSDRIEVATEWFSWSGRSGPEWFLGSHIADLICWLFGAYPRRVFAEGRKDVLASKGVDCYDAMQIHLSFPEGFAEQLSVEERSWVSPSSSST